MGEPPLDVLLDLTPLDTPSRYRGIGRYVRGLARALAALPATPQPGLTVAGLIRSRPGRGPLVAPTLRYAGDPARPPGWLDYATYLAGRRVALGTLAHSAGARLLHLTDPRGTLLDGRTPRLVTCHDLIPLLFPEEYLAPLPGASLLQRLRDLARYRLPHRILAVSEATRQDLVARLGLSPDAIDVVHHGVDHERFRPSPGGAAEPAEAARIAGLLGSAEPFLLYVGSGAPRKNLPLLVQAFSASGRAREVRLVLAGRLRARQRLPIERAVRETGLGERVLFAGFVAEDDIPALYRRCLAHVFPSSYEGFGLPVLEAMACGAPTVTTPASSLPEVAGEAALLVPARERAPLAAAIRRLVDEPALRQELRTRGLDQAARFTWERCARETLAVYRRTLDGLAR